MTTEKPVGWINPLSPPYRNDDCPCGKLNESGRPMKFKRCCMDDFHDAVRAIDHCKNYVRQKLVGYAVKKKLAKNGPAGWKFKPKFDGQKVRYFYEGHAILMVDYGDLPMVFDNIALAEKISAATPASLHLTYYDISETQTQNEGAENE